MSSHELVKGYNPPSSPTSSPLFVPDEIIDAHEKPVSKSKLTFNFRSKATEVTQISSSDMIQVYVNRRYEKRSKWSSDKPVLTFDRDSQTVTVIGWGGRAITTAVEDDRLALSEIALALRIQD